jgi:hypothetical protein
MINIIKNSRDIITECPLVNDENTSLCLQKLLFPFSTQNLIEKRNKIIQSSPRDTFALA